MKKLSYQEQVSKFIEHEKNNISGKHMTGFIVFTEDSFKRQYSLKSRTYEVSSGCKAFVPNMCGYSIFGDSLDGTDRGVRLDRYMRDEHGGADGWKVDYCYVE